MNALLRAFLEGAGRSAGRVVADDGDALAKTLASIYARGREAYPRLVVGEEAFGRHLAHCAKDRKAGGLANLAAEDLYLACACAIRARGAATAFERKYGPIIRRAAARVLATADERREAEQRAWHHIFVEDGQGPARIVQYSGRGPLESWVAVASMRIAVSFARAESVETRLRSKVIADTVGIDAERLSMKGQLRQVVATAIAEALDRLKPRERLILKLHVVSGMTLEAVSKSLGVTRQAVSKSFSRCRENILAEVEASLRTRLKISKEDLSSALRLVASQLDVSISRVLGSA